MAAAALCCCAAHGASTSNIGGTYLMGADLQGNVAILELKNEKVRVAAKAFTQTAGDIAKSCLFAVDREKSYAYFMGHLRAWRADLSDGTVASLKLESGGYDFASLAYRKSGHLVGACICSGPGICAQGPGMRWCSVDISDFAGANGSLAVDLDYEGLPGATTWGMTNCVSSFDDSTGIFAYLPNTPPTPLKSHAAEVEVHDNIAAIRVADGAAHPTGMPDLVASEIGVDIKFASTWGRKIVAISQQSGSLAVNIYSNGTEKRLSSVPSQFSLASTGSAAMRESTLYIVARKKGSSTLADCTLIQLDLMRGSFSYHPANITAAGGSFQNYFITAVVP